MATENWSYIGKGTIYVEDRAGAKGLLPIGNASQLEFSAEEDKKEQQDFTSPGGGLANSVTRISSVTAQITVLDISPRNLALGMRGAASAEAAGAVADERHTAHPGALIPFDFTPDLTQTITVTEDPDGTPSAAVLDTDFESTRAGILILEAGGIADGAELGIAYTKAPSEIMQALVDAGAEFRLVFDGLNEAQSGKAVTVIAHRVKFAPGQNMAFLGDEFAEMQMSADVLSDNTITGTGISRFFKVAMES